VLNPAPNHSHHEPTEDGSDISGNVPFFRDYENFNRNRLPRPRLGRGIAEGDGSRTSHLDTFHPTFGQQVPRRDEIRPQSTFNIDVGPELSEESKPPLPKAKKSGKFPCWISIQLLGIHVWQKAGPEER